ncbi:MAG: hypothetical protein HZY76_05500 [Anaerolineae bacterium]|nr:MAG: hypothetical protein HZY76_05500 [Anaerolineae bacterium]
MDAKAQRHPLDQQGSGDRYRESQGDEQEKRGVIAILGIGPIPVRLNGGNATWTTPLNSS